MNRDLVRKVAATIREVGYVDSALPKEAGTQVGGFDMRSVWFRCETPSCIAGWTLAVVSAELAESYAGTIWISIRRAGELMGLDEGSPSDLFSPSLEGTGYACSAGEGEEGWISPEHAARCLERLAQTGEVDWRGAKP